MDLRILHVWLELLMCERVFMHKRAFLRLPPPSAPPTNYSRLNCSIVNDRGLQIFIATFPDMQTWKKVTKQRQQNLMRLFFKTWSTRYLWWIDLLRNLWGKAESSKNSGFLVSFFQFWALFCGHFVPNLIIFIIFIIFHKLLFHLQVSKLWQRHLKKKRRKSLENCFRLSSSDILMTS